MQNKDYIISFCDNSQVMCFREVSRYKQRATLFRYLFKYTIKMLYIVCH